MPRISNGPKIRLSLDMTPACRASLETLRIQSDADSLTEVVRRALAVYELVLDTKSEGKELIVRDRHGEERRVILL